MVMTDPAPSASPPLAEQFQDLTAQSLAVLQRVLADDTVKPLERAQIALQILALPGANRYFNADSSLDALAALNLDSGVDNSLAARSPGPSTSIPSTSTAPPTAAPPYTWGRAPVLLPPRYVKIENFLTPDDNQAALQIALANHDKFIEASTTTNANNYRQSSVLYATYYADLYHLLRKRLLKILPAVMGQLDADPFLVSQVEMQMTAHNDGCFYKIHNDSGSPETETRVLTYVYYFHQEPKAYSGGALRIYETDLQGPATEPSEWFEEVVPANNTIVLFDSRVKHEVRPVVCPSHQFEDSRFTLNGWLRRV